MNFVYSFQNINCRVDGTLRSLILKAGHINLIAVAHFFIMFLWFYSYYIKIYYCPSIPLSELLLFSSILRYFLITFCREN